MTEHTKSWLMTILNLRIDEETEVVLPSSYRQLSTFQSKIYEHVQRNRPDITIWTHRFQDRQMVLVKRVTEDQFKYMKYKTMEKNRDRIVQELEGLQVGKFTLFHKRDFTYRSGPELRTAVFETSKKLTEKEFSVKLVESRYVKVERKL